MKKKRKSNAKEKINKRKCNVNNNEVRYLLKKFKVKNLEEVKKEILRDLKERLKKGLTDVRQNGKVKYKIWDIVICVVIANFSDIYDWEDIEEFVISHYDWLKSFLQMTGGVPDYQTYERVFSLIKHEELENILVGFYLDLIYATRREDLLNIDGRTSNGSARAITDYNPEKIKALNVLSVYSNNYGICLASEKIEDKTNEIPTIPTILERLNIEGCIVTWDALNTQKDNVRCVVGKHADYVIPIKGNHPTFYEELKLYFDERNCEEITAGRTKSAYMKLKEKNHSSIITYEYFQTEDVNWYEDAKDWEKLKSIGMVRKTIEKNGETNVECRYYISSLFIDIFTFAEATRKHWSVENKLHWHLDFTFKEDDNTTKDKDALMNLQLVNKFTLGILSRVKTHYDGKSLKKIRKLMTNNFSEYFETLLLYFACS